jgi:hypothetical protein
MERKIRVEI